MIVRVVREMRGKRRSKDERSDATETVSLGPIKIYWESSSPRTTGVGLGRFKMSKGGDDLV